MSFHSFPVGFWVSLATLAGAFYYAWINRRKSWAIPTLAVCATVFVWYHCDVLYNDYAEYLDHFSVEMIDAAWWQVTYFLVCFWALAPLVHAGVNRSLLKNPSAVASVLAGRIELDEWQPLLPLMLGGFAAIWAGVSVAALFRTDFDWQGVFFPWMGHLAEAWERDRIGGPYDFIISVVGHVHLFALSGFGIVAALTKNPRLRTGALLLMAISWPTVLLDRTRHTMLVLVLPGLCSLVFVRLRKRRLAQVGVLVGAFLATSLWFSFVMANRATRTIASAFASEGVIANSTAKHEGLNMFEELCWINKLIEDGTCPPNWGRRYFAEMVNIVPRGLWSEKPTIGLDYAVARGQATRETIGSAGATISTGMIGGGVNNFGPWLGPPAAALLMAGWVAVLARLDLTGQRFGYLLLYAIGLTLTFNLGRDITLMVIYPLIFGFAVIWCLERWLPPSRLWKLTSPPRKTSARENRL